METKSVQKAILKNHLADGNVHSARRLEAALIIPHQETAPKVRQLIAELIEEGEPICSCSVGYFMPRYEEDVNTYYTDLVDRAVGNLERARKVAQNWRDAGTK
jgi:hypothetical protein